MNFGGQPGNAIPFLTADKVLPIDITTNVMSTHTEYGSGKWIDVRQEKGALIYFHVQGNNAGCSANITFYFQTSPNGKRWSDLDSQVIALNGTLLITDNTTNMSVDLTGVDYIRLQRITNAETTGGYMADVNAAIRLVNR